MTQVRSVFIRLGILWGLIFSPQAPALELVFVPFVDAEIVHDQLSPISSELNKHFPGSYIYAPKDLNEYLGRHESMDVTYVDESLASQLITEYGYIPLLVSNEVIKATFVSMTNYVFGELNRNKEVIFSVNSRDLLTTGFAFSVIKENQKIELMDSNSNLLIRLLKKKNMVGVLPEEDIALLPNNLRSKLTILHQRKLSPIYFLVHPRHKDQAEKIQSVIFDFHKNWDRSQTKYVYLNYYTLNKIKSDEREYLSSKPLYEKYHRVLKRLNENN